ncbi:tetratricopeptide repeat protein [Zavarzinia sp.]|uniref:tetratricopeptide repeat protein n=1 Tax=Zavarzinia sp. TaxID=2027920 RepID=UPI003568CF32
MRLKPVVAAALLAAAVAAWNHPAWAFGGGSSTSEEFEAGQKAVDAKDYESAVKHLTAAVAEDSENADAENLLGFAHRKLGHHDEAQKHYWKALKLDPDHKGAHEYLGEAYLELKNLGKAEGQLAELKRLCPSGCTELATLQSAIDAYKKANPGS